MRSETPTSEIPPEGQGSDGSALAWYLKCQQTTENLFNLRLNRAGHFQVGLESVEKRESRLLGDGKVNTHRGRQKKKEGLKQQAADRYKQMNVKREGRQLGWQTDGRRCWWRRCSGAWTASHLLCCSLTHLLVMLERNKATNADEPVRLRDRWLVTTACFMCRWRQNQLNISWYNNGFKSLSH